MAFPEPRPQPVRLPQHLLRVIECQQAAVRAVRFNGKYTHNGYGMREITDLMYML